MGQYWKVVNLDKHEFIMPHTLGCGLKLCEQLATHPGTGAALIVLCAAMPEARGGGDFDLEENWHGPERKFPENNCTPGPMPEDYPTVAKRTIGRWAGDRIALVGDYASNEDLERGPGDPPISEVYYLCSGRDAAESWVDVSEDVARVIEHELCGRYEGSGWRDWREGSA